MQKRLTKAPFAASELTQGGDFGCLPKMVEKTSDWSKLQEFLKVL